jgi:hypothetical protein
MDSYKINEKIDIGTFISLYQELFGDFDKKYKGVKFTLREFLLQEAFVSKSPIPDSLELRQQIDSILKIKKPKEAIKKIFVRCIILGIRPKKAVKTMKEMIGSYLDIMKEYKKFKSYYLDLIQPFKEVIAIGS